MVIFDPLVYPMDTAWLNGKVSADHYRHTRPEYLRALEKAETVKPAPESQSSAEPPSDGDAPAGKLES
jgi:hypothetical protein